MQKGLSRKGRAFFNAANRRAGGPKKKKQAKKNGAAFRLHRITYAPYLGDEASRICTAPIRQREIPPSRQSNRLIGDEEAAIRPRNAVKSRRSPCEPPLAEATNQQGVAS